MGRVEWFALAMGVIVGLLVVVSGLLYLWDLTTEVTTRISEVIHG